MYYLIHFIKITTTTANTSSPHPFHTQNDTTKQQTKKTNQAKNNIKKQNKGQQCP